MKKKSLKGEISTILTLGTLIFLGVSSLASVVFLRKTQTTKTRAASCAKVENVSYSGDVAAGKTFTCLASTNGASPYTMACGISKNGGWPYGMQSGSCSGKNCTFSVKMDDQIEAGAVYQLVAFDFRTECGPDKDDAKRITLNVPGTQPQPTQVNCDQECCGKPDGFIYQRAIKASCDSNYKGGRYVIIDGVCQGGKKTEKPGCATCRTCQVGEQASDISPVPDADLAVNECNSSCEQKEGGNPTPNPNSTTTQTITPNPNPRGNPTNIPPPTNPPPAGITPKGGEGQPCKVQTNFGEYEYYCNRGLVCSEQSENGKCVKPRGGKDQPCISLYDSASKKYQYSCNGNLVCSTQYPAKIGICVEPTSPPAPTSQPGTTSATTSKETQTSAQAPTLKPASTCVNYSETPPIANLSCPAEYTEPCKRGELNGTRYVRRGCGEGDNSCRFSCKKIEDLIKTRENKYSGDCMSSDTCLVPEFSTIQVKAIVKVNNKRGVWLETIGIVDRNDNVLDFQQWCNFVDGCKRVDYSTEVELTIDVPRYYPENNFIFPIQPYANYALQKDEKQIFGNRGPVHEIKTLEISSPIYLEVNFD